jgi:hypothetical protein
MDTNDTIDNIPSGQPGQQAKFGIYKATVVGFLDKTYMGGLTVKIQRSSGNDNLAGQVIPVYYMSPFYGSTSSEYEGIDPNDYNNTQKSYGMWMVPPDVGATVIVVFANHDIKLGYWIGVVPDRFKNFSVPGLAATKYVVSDTRKTDTQYARVPVAEYNDKIDSTETDTTKILKPEHPLAKILMDQGLLQDDVRGITTSSARRENPSMVFGISTPGITDKSGKQGKIGPQDKRQSVPVSRLGGSTFVMDDGDDKFIRMTTADKGPPVYESLESLPEGQSPTGNEKIPHNELIRLRTRTGHQILLHNSEDLIYIGNAKGTTWIELTSNGKIDIFAEDSISIHTKADMNFRADRDVNIEAGRNVNIKSQVNTHIESTSNTEIFSGVDTLMTSKATSHINSGTTHLETAGKIYMNSSKNKALASVVLPTFPNPIVDAEGNTAESLESIMLRVPMHEPWPHHENLDPLSFTSTKTDIKTGAAISTPKAWKTYTLLTDTFEKFLKPAATEGGTNA